MKGEVESRPKLSMGCPTLVAASTDASLLSASRCTEKPRSNAVALSTPVPPASAGGLPCDWAAAGRCDVCVRGDKSVCAERRCMCGEVVHARRGGVCAGTFEQVGGGGTRAGEEAGRRQRLWAAGQLVWAAETCRRAHP